MPMILIQSVLGSAALLAAAWILACVLRRTSGRCRHALWSVAILASLALPALAAFELRLPVLPAETTAVTRSSAPAAPIGAAPPAGERVRSPARPREQGSGAHGIFPTAAAAAWTIWLLGAVTVLIRFAAGMLAVTGLARRGEAPIDRRWQDLVRQVALELRLRRPIRLRLHPDAGTPMTWGVRRPVVLLPGAARHWSRGRCAVVLRHEMAHVKRLDWLIEVAARLACAVYWFNPLVWVAARQLAAAREHACDETVVRLGTRPSAYAGHLLALARHVAAPAPPVLAMARTSHLEHRLMLILSRTAPSRSGAAPLAGSLALIALLVALIAAPPTHAVRAPVLARPVLEQDDPNLPSRRVERTVRVPAEGPIRIRNLAGNVEIRHHGGADVRLGAVACAGDERTLAGLQWTEGRDADGHPEWHLSWALDGLDEVVYPRLEPKQQSSVSGWDGRTIRVAGPASEAPVRFADVVVSIPRRSALALRIGVGAVHGKDLAGDAAISASHATVRLEGLEGSLAVTIGAGTVTVSDVEGSLSVTSGAGAIEVAGLLGDASLLTGAGDVTIDGGRTRHLAVTAGAGDVVVRLDGFAVASLHSGAGSITMASPLRGAEALSAVSGTGDVIVLAEPGAPFTAQAAAPLGRFEVGYDDARVGRDGRSAMRGAGGPAISLSSGTGSCTIRPQ